MESNMRKDIYETVTNRIIAELESGVVPWLKPWRNGVGTERADMPRNAVTGRAYSGVNVLTLWSVALSRGYSVGRWLTYKQAQGLGGNVRKGETGTHIIFLKTGVKKARDENGEEKNERFGMMREYVVFNVAQCDGLPEKVTQAAPLPPAPVLDANYKRFVAATGLHINYGSDRACYVPALHAIQMPHVAAFETVDHFKSTECHEMIHATGHKSCLDRDLNGRFGGESYAAEELIAELGAAFLCATLGVTAKLRHASYIANWLKVLKDDKRAVFTAASAASKAADYLLAFSSAESADDDAGELAIAA
jgi:antirestriction protein ArdC